METASVNKESFGADALQQIYQTRFGGNMVYRDNVWKILTKNFFQKWVGVQDIVLDLGAGYGEFINNIRASKKYAMDLNPDTPKRVSADVIVISQDCSQRWPLSDASLDVVFTSNFFEHLRDKDALSRTVAEISRCLKPGGRLVAMGPNIKYLPGEYWDFLDHHIPLSEQSISELCAQGGLSVEVCTSKFLPYTMSDGKERPLFLVAMYLRLPFAWRIFGKQFLVVARKRAE